MKSHGLSCIMPLGLMALTKGPFPLGMSSDIDSDILIIHSV